MQGVVVISQKSAVLVCYPAEAWNCTEIHFCAVVIIKDCSSKENLFSHYWKEVFCKLEQFSLQHGRPWLFYHTHKNCQWMCFIHVFESSSVLWCAEDCFLFSALSLNVFNVVTDALQYISILSSACAEGINTNTHTHTLHVSISMSQRQRVWNSHKYTRISNFFSVKIL